MKCQHFTCHSCPDENTTLRTRVEELEAENTALKVAVYKTANDGIWLDQKLKHEEQDNVSLSILLAEQRKRIEELEGEVDAVHAGHAAYARVSKDELTAAWKRIEELETMRQSWSEIEKDIEALDSRGEALHERVQELEATCAAQREALEAINTETMTEGSGQGAANIRRLVDWALSPTAGHDFRDVVLEEAAQKLESLTPHEGDYYCDGMIDVDEAASIVRSLKRGGK